MVILETKPAPKKELSAQRTRRQKKLKTSTEYIALTPEILERLRESPGLIRKLKRTRALRFSNYKLRQGREYNGRQGRGLNCSGFDKMVEAEGLIIGQTYTLAEIEDPLIKVNGRIKREGEEKEIITNQYNCSFFEIPEHYIEELDFQAECPN